MISVDFVTGIWIFFHGYLISVDICEYLLDFKYPINDKTSKHTTRVIVQWILEILTGGILDYTEGTFELGIYSINTVRVFWPGKAQIYVIS